MGIEPTQPAWEAGVLPLNYICIFLDFIIYLLYANVKYFYAINLCENLYFVSKSAQSSFIVNIFKDKNSNKEIFACKETNQNICHFIYPK